MHKRARTKGANDPLLIRNNKAVRRERMVNLGLNQVEQLYSEQLKDVLGGSSGSVDCPDGLREG